MLITKTDHSNIFVILLVGKNEVVHLVFEYNSNEEERCYWIDLWLSNRFSDKSHFPWHLHQQKYATWVTRNLLYKIYKVICHQLQRSNSDICLLLC